ncbi:MAG TPA: iron chelate uptake ABC transporter family permease subunit [Candidatus Dietzia intestinigallinarum]|nr:iron chelate uptake ABC transporter family permease subunit [Candidatus Dietzia intestinigallinarum]
MSSTPADPVHPSGPARTPGRSHTPGADALAAAHPTGRILHVGPVALRTSTRTITVTVTLIVTAVVLGAVGMTVGSSSLPIGDVVAALLNGMTGGPDLGKASKIVLDIRLPRVVTTVFAGAALGLSGAVFQSVSRNALGSPEIIGFTTGAATGAITQIVIFDAGPVTVSLGAVSGGLATAVVVYLLSVKNRVTGGYRLILVGIGVGAVLQAANNLLLVTGDLDSAVTANFWLAGSLDARGWEHALPVMTGVLVAIPLLLALGRRATLMEMGDDTASQLGIRVERTRLQLIAVAVLLAALATAAAGPIAFIALAAPQLATRLTRAPGMPVLTAAVTGSALLLVADVLARSVPVLATAPIGRVTGVVGGLYLIWLLARTKQV